MEVSGVRTRLRGSEINSSWISFSVASLNSWPASAHPGATHPLMWNPMLLSLRNPDPLSNLSSASKAPVWKCALFHSWRPLYFEFGLLFSIFYLATFFYLISYTKIWECARRCVEVLHTEAIISRTPVAVFNRLLAANGSTLWCHTSTHRTTQATSKGNGSGILFWLVCCFLKFYLLFFLCFFTYNGSSFQYFTLPGLFHMESMEWRVEADGFHVDSMDWLMDSMDWLMDSMDWLMDSMEFPDHSMEFPDGFHTV